MESGIIFLITISWISCVNVIQIGLCPFLRRGTKLMDLEGREIRSKWEEQREREIQLEYIEWAKNLFLIKGKKQEKPFTVKNGIIIIFSGRIFKCVFMTSYLDFMNKYFIEWGLKNHFWKCFSFIMISHCSPIERGHSLWTDIWAILLTSLFTYRINCLADMQKVQTETDLYRRDTNISTLCVN